MATEFRNVGAIYIYIYISIYIKLVCVCLSVCSRLNHALTAALIEFIFCMLIGVVPRSNISILEFSNLIIYDLGSNKCSEIVHPCRREIKDM